MRATLEWRGHFKPTVTLGSSPRVTVGNWVTKRIVP